MNTSALTFLSLSFIFLIAFSANASDTLRLASKVDEVTVFFNGAQVGRSVELNLPKGNHIIAINQLPGELDPSSIQATAPEGSTISAVRSVPQSRAFNEKSKAQLELEADIEQQKQNIKALKSEVEVYEIEERIMIDNSRLGAREGVSAVDEIRAAADLYRSRLNEIRKAKQALQLKIDAANEALKTSFVQFNKLNFESQRSYTEVVIAIQCAAQLNAKLSLSYYVPSAGWEPLYDFRVSDINSPLSLVYNAHVYQSTGEDWDDVKLTLSSVNPQTGTDRPELNPWLISYRRRVEPTQEINGTGELRGKVTDEETGEPLPFVNIVLLQNGGQLNGTTTDFDGNYTIKPIKDGSYQLAVSYVGYQSVRIEGLLINTNKITFQDLQLETGIVLDEFEVVEYSVPLIDKDGGASGGVILREEIARLPARSASNVAVNTGGVQSRSGGVQMRGAREDDTFYYIDGIKVRGSTNLPKSGINEKYTNFKLEDFDSEDFIANTTAVNVTNLEYAIDIPYSVRSDGRDYQLKIKEVRVPAEYVYHAIPKLNTAAYLTANLGKWSELNLLSGTASIYFKGTFTGNTFVDATQTSDTLTLSLGPDKSVVAQREGNRELSDKRIIGNNVRESQAWDLSLRNNRQEPVRVILYDQFPVSELKSVQVNLLTSDGAQIDEKTGELRWDITLDPASRQERRFSYELRYPQGNAGLLR